MKDIINFFIHNKEQLVDFISGVGVNWNKTSLKYGCIEGEKVSVAFYIEDGPDLSITDFETKVKCLFNTNEADVEEISSFLNTDRPCKIHFSPVVKIKDNPLVNVFQMNINFLA